MESFNWSVWGPPLLVLGLGVAVGVWVAFTSRVGPPVHTRRQDLEARRQVLLNALHELEADRSKLDDAAYTARREALLDQAAEVLRALEAPEPATAPAAAPRPGGGARAVTWALAGVVFLAVAGGVLQSTIRPRTDPPMPSAASAAVDRLAALQAQVQANPQDIDALNALTRLALETQQLDLAMQSLDQARAIDPEHPGVLTHFGALLLFIGRDAQAEEQLRAALARAPGYGEARLWLAVLLANRGQLSEAADEARALAADPTASAEDRLAASSLLASLGRAGTASTAGGTPDGAGEAPAASGPPRVSGRVLGEGLAPGGVLFVYVRSSEVPAGRPLAAKRVADWTLPLDFTLSDADLLAGGAWPEQVWLQAKVSRSGDPMQRSPEDVASAVLGPLAPGAAGVELKLE